MIKTMKILIILIIFGFALANLSFAQQTIQVPENLEEAKEMGEKALETGKRNLPDTLERIWKEDILPVWQKMYGWFEVNIWSKIKDFFQNEVIPRFKGEYEKRKPIIEQEFEKEKEEMKEELPEVTKSLWERLKELWE
ncbi:MAG: hypothetical protein ACKKMO_01455 [Candidatus Nealsonbacteria bacterium]